MTFTDLELLVIVFSLTYCTAIPVYLILREKMTGEGVLDYFAGFLPKYYHRDNPNHQHKKQDYGRRRVLKLTAFNLAGNTLLTAFAIAVLVVINPVYSATALVLILILFFLICLTFYGAGIYITTIVIEAYTKVSLRRIYSFKTQFLGISLFHGAISHFFVCAGWIGVIAVLGIIDLLEGSELVIQNPLLLLGGGFMFALFTSIGQVVNKTVAIQLTSAGITFLIFVAVLVLSTSQFSMHAMTIFSASALFFYTLILVLYMVRHELRQAKNHHHS